VRKASVQLKVGGAIGGLALGALLFAAFRNQNVVREQRDLIGAVIWVLLGTSNLYRLFTLAAFPGRFAHEPHERAREAAKACIGVMVCLGLLAPEPVKIVLVIATVCLVFATWFRIPARLFREPTRSAS
jgi:hypothetical protein